MPVTPKAEGISIRMATRADAGFIARAILAATRSHLPKGWFDIILDRPEDQCLDVIGTLTTTETVSHWHYSRFLIAECDNRPVSGLSAFRAKDAYAVATAALMEGLERSGISASETAAIWKRGAYMFKCTMRPCDDWWVIENLATLPEFRGSGCTSTLLSHSIESGRAHGSTHVQVSVFIGNASAERLYVKAGFHLTKERRDADFEATSGAPGLRQYVRRLQIEA
jgi:ribosomal protein S18 acetylase RimI-like enzyme